MLIKKVGSRNKAHCSYINFNKIGLRETLKKQNISNLVFPLNQPKPSKTWQALFAGDIGQLGGTDFELKHFTNGIWRSLFSLDPILYHDHVAFIRQLQGSVVFDIWDFEQG